MFKIESIKKSANGGFFAMIVDFKGNAIEIHFATESEPAEYVAAHNTFA
jgi:hypothetical protein